MSKAERMSFEMIDATCPRVDELAAKCVSDIKHNLSVDGFDWNTLNGDDNIESMIYDMASEIKDNVTQQLRNSLIDSCQRIVDLERDSHRQ